LKQHRAEHIIDGTKGTFGFTIMRRGVWTIHPHDDSTRGKECMGGGIVELTTVVTLYDSDGAAKLRGNKGEKIDNVEKVSNLTCKGKVYTK
jgi:hypothetical protein